MDQNNILENRVKFNNKPKPKANEGGTKEANTFDSVNALYIGRQLTLNVFRSGIFSTKATQRKRLSRLLASNPWKKCKHLKILTPKETLQRLPIALAHIKEGNTYEKLLN